MPVKMTREQWNKPNGKTHEPRLDILVRAIHKGIPLVTIDNKSVIIKNSKENLEEIERFKLEQPLRFNLKTKDGRTIVSSNIGKTEIFGGGRGQGGGTVQTAQAESLQCFYCAAVVNGGRNLSIEAIRPLLRKYRSRCHTGGIPLERAEALDESWHISAYAGAIALYDKGFINKRHTFHRDSPEMKAIYKMKRTAFEHGNTPNLSNDKWNPGDIWAIEDGTKVATALDAATITSLNASLLRAYRDRKIVGISLKKVMDPNKIRLTEVNASGHYEADRHVFTGAELMSSKIKTATFFRNQGGVVYADNKHRIEFRPPTFFGPINAEITLATARGGRAGLAVIDYAMYNYLDNYKIHSNLHLRETAKKIEKGDQRLKEEFFRMANFVTGVSRDDFYTELKHQPLQRIHSKFGTTEMIYGIMKAPAKNRDAFVSYIMNYAGSKLEESSVYVKVYQ